MNKACCGFLLLLGSFITAVNAVAVDGLSDPTRPSFYLSGGNTYLNALNKEYVLNSIIISDQRRVAVINGERLGEGDRIKNARVGSINKSGVTLTIDGARVDIELSQNNFKSR